MNPAEAPVPELVRFASNEWEDESTSEISQETLLPCKCGQGRAHLICDHAAEVAGVLRRGT
jgi:hypothetical protein